MAEIRQLWREQCGQALRSNQQGALLGGGVQEQSGSLESLQQIHEHSLYMYKPV